MTPLYAGIGGVVRELTEMYTGVDGVVKPMTEMWAGVRGVERQIFSAVTLPVFVVDGTQYQFESGMTWVQFCASQYNVGGFQASAMGVYNAAGTMRLYYGGNYVQRTQEIIENGAYTWGSAPP